MAVAAAVSCRGRRTSEQRAATFRDQGRAMAVWTAANAHGESDGARRERFIDYKITGHACMAMEGDQISYRCTARTTVVLRVIMEGD